MFVIQEKINTRKTLIENTIDSVNDSYSNIEDIPYEYREDITNDFFKKTKNDILKTINKIKEMKNQKLLTILQKKIVESLDHNKEIISKMNELHATESIIKLGFFDQRVIIPYGIPIKLTPEMGLSYDNFLKIIRNYVFDYKDEWVKDITPLDFREGGEKICNYLQLYCYIKKIFINSYEKPIDLTDLYSQVAVETYCYPTLSKIKPIESQKNGKQQQQSQKKKGGQYNRDNRDNRNNRDNRYNQQKKNNGDQQRRRNGDPQKKKNGDQQKKKNGDQQRGKNGNKSKKEYIDYFDSYCDINKTKDLFDNYLQEKDEITKQDEIATKYISLGTYSEKKYFETIIRNHIRGMTFNQLSAIDVEDSEGNLEYFVHYILFKQVGNGFESFSQKEEREKEERKKRAEELAKRGEKEKDETQEGTVESRRQEYYSKYNSYFSNDDPIIKDPFLGFAYTYGELSNIFPPRSYTTIKQQKGKKNKKEVTEKKLTNPYDRLKDFFKNL